MIEQRHLPENLRACLAAAACRASNDGGSEYVGQENFMTADEILALGRAAGAGFGGRVLDLCCGRGGAALHLVQELEYEIVGLDLSPEAVMLAREAAAQRGLARRASFQVGNALSPPEPLGSFDAVLVLETMLAFEDKGRLLQQARRLLCSGGRLALTLEEGCPLSTEEWLRLPETEDVWLSPEGEFLFMLERAGFRVLVKEDHTDSHARVARRLAGDLRKEYSPLVAAAGEATYEQLLAAHERWAEWLENGRVRKLAIVAEVVPDVKCKETV